MEIHRKKKMELQLLKVDSCRCFDQHSRIGALKLSIIIITIINQKGMQSADWSVSLVSLTLPS